MDEETLAEAERHLEQRRADGGWLQLAAEIHYHGREAPFWILVRDAPDVARALPVFMEVVQPFIERFPGTEFSVSFHTKRDGRKITWDAVWHDELAEGRVSRVLGRRPSEDPLDEYDVFGRNF